MTPAIEEALLQLSAKERADLALKLLESLETLDEREYERVWGEESVRRLASGEASVPGEDVAVKARALLQ